MNLLDELTNGPLAQEILPFIQSGDDAKILEILQRKDIPSPGQISSHDIKRYFFLIGVRMSILDSNTPSCREVTTALEDFPVFYLTNPTVYSKFVQTLDNLVAEPLIPDFTESHKQTILSMGSTFISREDQLGTPITISQIAQSLRG